MALNRSFLSNAPFALPFANFHPSNSERCSCLKSTTSKKQKIVSCHKKVTVSTTPARTLHQSSANSVDNGLLPRTPTNVYPSTWGDFFRAYEAMEPFPEEQKQELNQLREEIIKKLKSTPDESSLKLDLIDNIQRLGVSYQFEDEIEASLSNIYNSYHDLPHNDLHTVALRFRLLRNQGLHVSSECLKKFQNRDGEFDQAYMANDARGLLSLYESSHYSVHGEDILDEALRVTTSTLKSLKNTSSGLVANKINQALAWPIRKTLNRVTARKYISIYQEDESHNEVLLKFAKLDFNRLQRIHQDELCALTKWWNGIDCATHYPFVRDRLVESYFVVLGLFFEPQYCLARKIVHKVHNVHCILDDIYDSYGTLDELLLLTDAVERWNIDAVNQLPHYMKYSYRCLLELYTEMEDGLAKYGWSERVEYVQAEGKRYLKLSYENAFWNQTGYLPPFEEYMEKGTISNGVHVLLTASYMGMGNLVTKEVLDWAAGHPLATRAASTISKFIDDICDHEEEEQATTIECYMKEYSVSKQEAIKVIEERLSNAWKDLNKECLLPTPVPLAIIERVNNVARMMFTLYKYGDGFTDPKTSAKQLIKPILVDPIVL